MANTKDKNKKKAWKKKFLKELKKKQRQQGLDEYGFPLNDEFDGNLFPKDTGDEVIISSADPSNSESMQLIRSGIDGLIYPVTNDKTRTGIGFKKIKPLLMETWVEDVPKTCIDGVRCGKACINMNKTCQLGIATSNRVPTCDEGKPCGNSCIKETRHCSKATNLAKQDELFYQSVW
jgi:hypothetical protein